MNQMLSLYDYLDKPAGSELGKKIAQQATEQKIVIVTKYVSNPKYTGQILMYPKDWLDKMFSQSNLVP